MSINNLSGILIFASFLITLISYFFKYDIMVFAGFFAWLSFVLLFKRVGNLKLLLILLFLSFIFFTFSFFRGFEIDLKRAILVNQYMLTLLIGVGFLRLVAIVKKEKTKELPIGKNSFFKTYWGVHLFGSVINISSLILVTDKLFKKAKLTKLQVIVLSRSFATDAYWSPFFVAFAAVSTYSSGFEANKVIITGLILTLIGFFVTYMEVTKNYNLEKFRGYPLQLDTLILPVVLAILVLLTNHYYPDLKVILLISLFSLLLSSIFLPFKFGIKGAIKCLNTQIIEELPKMKNEISLFLVAGMFGVSISTLLTGFDIAFPFDKFDGISASFTLLIQILLSFIGIHPIITIAIIGNWTGDINHTLLAVTFLMAWSTSICTSPFSGLSLTMQARYEIDAFKIFKINLPYAIKMYIFCVIILLLLSKYLGI